MVDTWFRKRLRADGSFQSTVPVRATGDDIDGGSGGEAAAFTFASPVKVVRIVKHPDCSAELVITINRSGVAADDWDEVMATDERRLTISQVPITSLEILSDVDVVYGEDLAVYGWA